MLRVLTGLLMQRLPCLQLSSWFLEIFLPYMTRTSSCCKARRREDAQKGSNAHSDRLVGNSSASTRAMEEFRRSQIREATMFNVFSRSYPLSCKTDIIGRNKCSYPWQSFRMDQISVIPYRRSWTLGLHDRVLHRQVPDRLIGILAACR